MSEHSLSMRAKCTVLPRALRTYVHNVPVECCVHADGSAESAFLAFMVPHAYFMYIVMPLMFCK